MDAYADKTELRSAQASAHRHPLLMIELRKMDGAPASVLDWAYDIVKVLEVGDLARARHHDGRKDEPFGAAQSRLGPKFEALIAGLINVSHKAVSHA